MARWVGVLVFVLAMVPVCVAADRPAPDLDVMVPMSDSVRLATNVYFPGGDATGKYGVILERTPYSKDTAAIALSKLFEKGYVVVTQNLRGTPVGNPTSEGEWHLFEADGWGGPGERDGVDTVAWIRAQAWSNGRVAVAGFSGSGIPALQLVAASPEGLVCAFVNATSDSMYETVFPQGAYRKNTIETWPQAKPVLPEVWAHPYYDDYWVKRDARARCASSKVPVYLGGGWFDLFQRNVTAFYAAQDSTGLPGARGNCTLVVAPLSHGAGSGKLSFPDRGPDGPDKLVGSMHEWFAHWVKGEANGIDEKAGVALFHMTTADDAPGNRWERFDSWPPPSEPLTFFMSADGTLSKDAGTAGALSYRYDPKSPMPTVGGNNLQPPAGPQDQAEVEQRKDQLLFTSAAFAEPLTIRGAVEVLLHVSSDAIDTDFGAKLTDVFPDGRSMLMMDGMARARYREGLDKGVFMEPGKVYAIRVDLGDTYWTVPAGHRLRLSVSSSNAPRYEPNTNTGEVFKQESGSKLATNTVHMDKGHASALILPIAKDK